MLGTLIFSDMVAEVGRIVGDFGTGRQRPIKDGLQRAYDGIAAAVEWPQLVAWDESGLRTLGSTSVASLEAGEPEVPAPFQAGKVRSAMLQGQQGPALEVIQPGLMAEIAGSQLTTQRRPAYMAQIGVTAQTLRLAAAGALTAYATDSSANDNTRTVLVEYRTSSAPVGSESMVKVTGNFSSGVAITGTADAGYPVSKVTLPSGWAGNFQIRDGSGNVIVEIPSALLPATTTLAETQTICKPLYRVWPVPDTDYGLTWTWWRRPRRLVDDSDTPEIPVSSYLVSTVAAEILRHMDKGQMALLHERKAEEFVRMLLRQNNRGPIHVLPKGGNFITATGADYGR